MSYVKMGTTVELGRAIIPLGVFVAQGHVEFFDAIDKLVVSFVRGPWSGRSEATVLKFEDRAITALLAAIYRYEAAWPVPFDE